MQLGRLDHVGIAVTDLAAARALYEGVLGLEVTHEEVIEDQGVHELLLRAGEAYVQLVAPLTPDSPVGRFLAKRACTTSATPSPTSPPPLTTSAPRASR
jgi:methylmalonyl-CoA epimerase